jgi:hypothetical protein
MQCWSQFDGNPVLSEVVNFGTLRFGSSGYRDGLTPGPNISPTKVGAHVLLHLSVLRNYDLKQQPLFWVLLFRSKGRNGIDRSSPNRRKHRGSQH